MATSGEDESQELSSEHVLQKPRSDATVFPHHHHAERSSYVDDATSRTHHLKESSDAEPGAVEHNDEDDIESDWTNESLMEQHIDLIDDEDYNAADTDCCGLEESKQLRKQLREVGPEEFVRRTLESGQYTVRKLCTAFGVVFPKVDFITSGTDEMFLPVLGALMKKELTKRHRLGEFTNIDHAANLLRECKNVIILTGAGISTNLGIPDFRSKGTGLYSRLEHLGLSDPQEVFDISLFREDPTIFYSIAKDIVPASKRFSPTHAFIRLLQDKGKLLTNFTQNIDNLEDAAGILPEKLIQCHGSFATATCQQCAFKCPGDQIEEDLKAGRVARCPACLRGIRQLQPLGLKRKHSPASTASKKKQRRDFDGSSDSEDQDDDMDVAGVMKPDITFFGEGLPKTFHDRLIQHDRDRVDLVIVIGTSLKVAPVADIPDFLPENVPQIYISRDPVNHIEFDIELLGDCDQIVTELCRRAGWDFNHEMVPPGQILEARPYSEVSTTRWLLSPIEGSATTTREALDSGTLGHGSALSPSQERFGPQSAIASNDKVREHGGMLPTASIPKSPLPGPISSEIAATNPQAVDLQKTSTGQSPGNSLEPKSTNNDGFNGDGPHDATGGDAGESITLTPRSPTTPAGLSVPPDPLLEPPVAGAD